MRKSLILITLGTTTSIIGMISLLYICNFTISTIICCIGICINFYATYLANKNK